MKNLQLEMDVLERCYFIVSICLDYKIFFRPLEYQKQTSFPFKKKICSSTRSSSVSGIKCACVQSKPKCFRFFLLASTSSNSSNDVFERF